MQVKPSQPIRRAKPSPQLALALAQQEQKRPRTTQQQAQEIHARVELLRLQTYLVCIRKR